MKKIFCSIVFVFLLKSTIFADQEVIKIANPSVTYNRAQVVEWIDNDIFTIGRWDGTISVFREPKGKEYGPIIIQALTVPANKGIEMLQKIGKALVVSSNNSRSMAVWRIHKNILILKNILQYDSNLGTVNASTDLIIDGKLWLIVGHANGYVSQWLYENEEFKFVKHVNVRTNSEPANPFNLYNIRSVVPFKNDLVILGSEDGDISIYKVSTGDVLIRKRYNQDAKRGINSMSYDDGYLLLGNCSVGSNDKNLWLYKINEKTIQLIDSINLIKDMERKQVFNFDVEFLRNKEKRYFYASTEEGLIWFGEVENEHLKVLNNAKVSFGGGAALDIDPDKENIAAISHAIKLYPLNN